MTKEPTNSEGGLLNNLVNITNQVTSNFHTVKAEWQALKSVQHEQTVNGDSQHVVVAHSDLNQLLSEVTRLKNLVRQIITPDYLTCIKRLRAENEQLLETVKNLEQERDHWHARCEAALADMDSLKQEKLEARCEVQELGQQLSQQSEYCASMGAAACTLLWRVSRSEDSIQAILTGTKVDEFLKMVSSTLESYLLTYEEEIPQEQADETQFILALCGTITNVAASALGRDFLVTNSNGIALMDMFMTALADAPNKECGKMKNLILMTLYNISINQKGLKHICRKTGLIALLVWITKDAKHKEIRANALRLIQSMLYEQTDPTILQEASEAMSLEFVQELSTDPCLEIRELALEIVADSFSADNEP